MTKSKLKVNFQKIFSVFLCAALSFSLLCINVSAFTFDGENRSIKDIYSDWFKSTNDFVSGNSSFEEWTNDNIRFQTDLIGSNLFPGTETELDRYIDELEDKLHTAVEGTDNKIDDSVINIFDKTLETLGVFDFREQFESWYQDKYGKEYGKHENAFDVPFDKSTYSYYIKTDCGDYYRYLFFNSSKKIFDVTTDYGIKFISVNGVTSGSLVTKYKSSEDASLNNSCNYPYGGNYPLEGSPKDFSTGLVISHNLPLNYGGDIVDPDSTIDDPFNDFGGELVAPTITLPELKDLLTDLDDDLQNSEPDSENPNKGLEIKITQLINKMHNDFSNVIDVLKKILAKLTEFFNAFTDTFSNFFGKLGEFFQSIFVPSDDYISSTMLDIKAEFDEAFSFAGDLRFIVDCCVDSYKNGSTSSPEISVDIEGFEPQTIDFSFLDSSILLIRSILCAAVYATFAFNMYRRIPCYISGGGER